MNNRIKRYAKKKVPVFASHQELGEAIDPYKKLRHGLVDLHDKMLASGDPRHQIISKVLSGLGGIRALDLEDPDNRYATIEEEINPDVVRKGSKNPDAFTNYTTVTHNQWISPDFTYKQIRGSADPVVELTTDKDNPENKMVSIGIDYSPSGKTSTNGRRIYGVFDPLEAKKFLNDWHSAIQAKPFTYDDMNDSIRDHVERMQSGEKIYGVKQSNLDSPEKIQELRYNILKQQAKALVDAFPHLKSKKATKIPKLMQRRYAHTELSGDSPMFHASKFEEALNARAFHTFPQLAQALVPHAQHQQVSRLVHERHIPRLLKMYSVLSQANPSELRQLGVRDKGRALSSIDQTLEVLRKPFGLSDELFAVGQKKMCRRSKKYAKSLSSNEVLGHLNEGDRAGLASLVDRLEENGDPRAIIAKKAFQGKGEIHHHAGLTGSSMESPPSIGRALQKAIPKEELEGADFGNTRSHFVQTSLGHDPEGNIQLSHHSFKIPVTTQTDRGPVERWKYFAPKVIHVRWSVGSGRDQKDIHAALSIPEAKRFLQSWHDFHQSGQRQMGDQDIQQYLAKWREEYGNEHPYGHQTPDEFRQRVNETQIHGAKDAAEWLKREVEKKKAKEIPALSSKPKTINIDTRSWWRRGAGGTYSTAGITVDGHPIKGISETGTTGDQAMQDAVTKLVKSGLIPQMKRWDRFREWAERNGIQFNHTHQDVQRERDLHKFSRSKKYGRLRRDDELDQFTNRIASEDQERRNGGLHTRRIYADFLGDIGDPREAILRRDIQRRETNGGGPFSGYVHTREFDDPSSYVPHSQDKPPEVVMHLIVNPKGGDKSQWRKAVFATWNSGGTYTNAPMSGEEAKDFLDRYKEAHADTDPQHPVHGHIAQMEAFLQKHFPHLYRQPEKMSRRKYAAQTPFGAPLHYQTYLDTGTNNPKPLSRHSGMGPALLSVEDSARAGQSHDPVSGMNHVVAQYPAGHSIWFGLRGQKAVMAPHYGTSAAVRPQVMEELNRYHSNAHGLQDRLMAHLAGLTSPLHIGEFSQHHGLTELTPQEEALRRGALESNDITGWKVLADHLAEQGKQKAADWIHRSLFRAGFSDRHPNPLKEGDPNYQKHEQLSRRGTARKYNAKIEKPQYTVLDGSKRVFDTLTDALKSRGRGWVGIKPFSDGSKALGIGEGQGYIDKNGSYRNREPHPDAVHFGFEHLLFEPMDHTVSLAHPDINNRSKTETMVKLAMILAGRHYFEQHPEGWDFLRKAEHEQSYDPLRIMADHMEDNGHDATKLRNWIGRETQQSPSQLSRRPVRKLLYCEPPVNRAKLKRKYLTPFNRIPTVRGRS